MRSSSRDALVALQTEFDAKVETVDDGDLDALAGDIASFTRLLATEGVLRKHLATRADEPKEKVALVNSLLTGKVGPVALDVIRTAVGLEWSSTRDLTTSLERLARLTILIEADRAGQIGDVEDELFRFGRTLDDHAQFAALLSDVVAPLDGRLELLGQVLGSKATSYTTRLLTLTMQLLRGRSMDSIVPELADLAAARRGESVVSVVAAAPLTESQEARLAEVMAKIRGRKVSLQFHIDPSVIGGLEITAGHEIIDGTIAKRLVSATSQLPN